MIKIRKSCIYCIIAVFILSMTASTLIFISQSKSVLHDNYETDTRVVTRLIYNVMDNSFIRPIVVSETISNDYTTKSLLNINTKQDAENIEAHAAEHLSSIRDGFGYSLVFAVSDKARSYFSYDGIRTYVVEGDENFKWYTDFVNSGKKYGLDVSADHAANWELSVFINTAVYNEQNRFIGVCGLGIDMSDLQNILSRYEKMYNIQIDIVNKDGLVMVNSDLSKIKNEYVDIENLSDYSDGECYYEVRSDGDRTIMYFDNLDWYLVVKNLDTISTSYNKIFPYIFICMIISLIVLLGLLRFGTDVSSDKTAPETEKKPE